ncbi:hypothetical protein PN471_01880 [Aphanizomenon sp. CS-733/32]|nr:hypothetical protein [Aphanizomenon sp. CS-733/32]MDB9307419.1 hypothetical protein [Aphanizomenon sp. CS-733/32]
MKYVLDTHALIWFLEGNLKLGANAKAILCDPNLLTLQSIPNINLLLKI